MKHGGKRTDAGRKPSGLVNLYIAVAPETDEFLREKTKGKKTLGNVVDKAVALLRLVS